MKKNTNATRAHNYFMYAIACALGSSDELNFEHKDYRNYHLRLEPYKKGCDIGLYRDRYKSDDPDDSHWKKSPYAPMDKGRSHWFTSIEVKVTTKDLEQMAIDGLDESYTSEPWQGSYFQKSMSIALKLKSFNAESSYPLKYNFIEGLCLVRDRSHEDVTQGDHTQIHQLIRSNKLHDFFAQIHNLPTVLINNKYNNPYEKSYLGKYLLPNPEPRYVYDDMYVDSYDDSYDSTPVDMDRWKEKANQMASELFASKKLSPNDFRFAVTLFSKDLLTPQWGSTFNMSKWSEITSTPKSSLDAHLIKLERNQVLHVHKVKNGKSTCVTISPASKMLEL